MNMISTPLSRALRGASRISSRRASSSASPRVLRYAQTILLALPLLAGSLTSHAATESDDLARTRYQTYAGDVNADGRPDVLLRAMPVVLNLPMGDDIDALIPVAPPAPSLLIASRPDGSYALTENPPPAMLGHPAWRADSHVLQFDTAGAMRIVAVRTGMPDFRVAPSAATGSLQLLSPSDAHDGAATAKTATRTVAFEYDPVTRLLMREIIEPDLPQLRLETTYAYDAWGNRTGTTLSSPASGSAAIETAGSSTGFDALGRFPVTGSNALGQRESRTFDPVLGVMTSLTGPNQLSTRWQYDGFGRKLREIRADGTQTRWDYAYCLGVANGSTPCPARARTMIQTTPLAADGVTPNGPWSKVYFDELERQIQSESPGFDGVTLIIVRNEYDQLGRLQRASRPHHAQEAPHWTSNTHDALGRVIATTLPDNSQTSVIYDGATITTINALQQRQTRITNSQGQLVQVIDTQGSSIRYAYDAFGNLASTTDVQGNVIQNSYDLRGRKIAMRDPDMGSWTYRYDVLGRLVSQTDAKQQVTTIIYDRLGRVIRRIEPDLLSDWRYDSCANGIGKLCSSATSHGYSQTISYDSLGRATRTSTTIDAAYGESVSYDSHGRIATLSYPTGFAVKYVYTALGTLQEVRNNANNALFWRADAKDAEGHLLRQTYGNNISTQQIFDGPSGRLTAIQAGAGHSVQNFAYRHDAVGNLLARSDLNKNLSEAFTYDALNRLVTSTLNAGTSTLDHSRHAYDSIGNHTGHSSVGTFLYGAANSRPHAIREIAYAAGGRRSYSYDANGNLLQEAQFNGAGTLMPEKARRASYTSFNMPRTLTTPSANIEFAYGPEHQRIRQIASSGTTIYLNPDNQGGLFYEKETRSDASIEHRHYINAGGQVIAMVKQIAATTSTRYFHRDQLGSTAIITNEAGVVVERLAYEAFGRRRTAEGHNGGELNLMSAQTDRGYTNHEHLDEIGLIHMNGRLYDPVIGRFLTADPHIQAPDNLQSYNRYSYVWNNPLNATDPTGYFKISSWLNSMVRASYMPTPRNLFNAVHHQPGMKYVDRALLKHPALQAVGQIAAAKFGGPAGAAAFSAYMAGLRGGSSGDMLRSAAISFGTAAAFYAVGEASASHTFENVAGHALVGCASAVASGGNCGAGALSAAIPAALPMEGFSREAKLVVHAVVGGSVSVAAGGRFENGAVTAAYGYLFNELLHIENGLYLSGYETRDPASNARIWKLDPLGVDPSIKQDVVTAINLSEALGDAPLRVAQGYRTVEEQDALYAQGRTTPGPIVTHAKGGESRHNKGTAVDVFRISGKNLHAPSSTTVGTFKRFGFSWGGDWPSPKTDRPHFQR